MNPPVLVEQVREYLNAGLDVPIVDWTGAKVHRVVRVDESSDALTACGRRISKSIATLVACALELERPRPCLNCHRSERT